jgi:8-hydroxy-5-deazaflavin:NADPH oxidoreductase
MTYAIIGSGNIGSAVARQFARKSIDVAITNARGPGSLAALCKELGHHIIPQTLEAALRADIVILAAPFSAVSVIARAGSDWIGKIVIDATNAIDFPAFTPTDLGGRPSSEVVAEQLRGARLVLTPKWRAWQRNSVSHRSFLESSPKVGYSNNSAVRSRFRTW